ncbi:hypothetical protein HO173_012552 [Letharia columbiana]|uniref:Protein kinase domain-containing protein n=1 Tax=Letharia columbiana TaxID=112416 RepID=A0A8H6CMF6_9LECA|nr:uncharacterized protein HO173_012552 [Letharia columbiana]KAF6226062.1 hypothetical protein HO173_012552 [Letharia columbiana]
MDESAMANQYQVLEELGSGSFGIVYKAIELASGEVVAIKHACTNNGYASETLTNMLPD